MLLRTWNALKRDKMAAPAEEISKMDLNGQAAEQKKAKGNKKKGEKKGKEKQANPAQKLEVLSLKFANDNDPEMMFQNNFRPIPLKKSSPVCPLSCMF